MGRDADIKRGSITRDHLVPALRSRLDGVVSAVSQISETVSSSKTTVTAGEDVTQGMIGAFDSSGNGVLASPTTSANLPGFFVFLSDAISGNDVEIATTGFVTVSGAAFALQSPIFLTASGVPSTTYPDDTVSGMFIQALGVAVTSTKFFIKIESPNYIFINV
jgi:hypothetical protein